MKKFLVPLLLFAGVFLATLLVQRYTFVYQEYEGLFLLTGDYFAHMFQHPFPISGVVASFLTQFFRFSVYAPFIVSCGVVGAFFLFRSLLGRLSLGWDILSAALSCGLWVVIAFAPTAQRGTAVVLILALVWAASRFLPKRKTRELPFWLNLGGSVLLVGGVFLFLAVSPQQKRREKTSAVKVAVVQANWDRVLTLVTPQVAAQDRSLLPYAGLALGQKGQLGARLFEYPVHSEADFDLAGVEDSPNSLFFKAFLYETLNCPNEAIHNDAQLALLQEHGQCFMTLRHLLANNVAIGNYPLARKYAAVLSKSTLHGQYVRFFQARMALDTPREPSSLAFRERVPLLSTDPFYNLYTFQANGMVAPATLDRLLTTLLLRRDLDRFQALLLPLRSQIPTLQRHFEEALLLAGGAQDWVSVGTLDRYAAFQADMMNLPPQTVQKKYADTYWVYYASTLQE